MSATRIATLNDRLRTTFKGGKVLITSGVAALGEQTVARVVTALREFTAFDPENDPHKEHDFAVLEIDGHTCFFKIDYYDLEMQYHSEDPTDPEKTVRVLTVGLISEY